MSYNRLGLSRDIPDQIKREVRSACGFGCVICGCAIYQYEHLDPIFAQAKEHDPNNIVLLCASCHDKVTRGIWSKEKVSNAQKKPYAKIKGHSEFSLDVSVESGLKIRVGQTEFIGIQDIILIDGVSILSIDNPEQPNSPPRINAKFYDRKNTLISQIINNEWRGETSAFDIEIIGKRITVRSDSRKIDLILRLEPPNGVLIDKLHLFYNNKSIVGESKIGFKVEANQAAVVIPKEKSIIEHAPYWISISDKTVSIGSYKVINFIHTNGSKSSLPGTMNVTGSRIEQTDPKKEGIPLPPGAAPGKKVMKITKLTDVGESGQIVFNIPVIRPAEKDNVGNQTLSKSKKIGRNDLCPCGSGKKYKYCHGRT